ncbi:MAG: hypothetical protein P8P74_11275 [Crocinitomicaceae bacterium]|nr:hypothetical protein [Crocinitomicaceae bacterium]
MDNPVDHPIDLGLVNYARHPENKEYVVYRFADEHRANSFEEALKEKDIPFETDTHEKKQVTYYLYGIHKNHYKVTEKLNYKVEAQHRKPFIPYAGFRWFLLIASGIVMTIAILGYCKAQDKLSSHNETPASVNSTE